MSVYHLFTLGRLQLDGPTGAARALRRQERILLAYLARRPGTRVRRAELAALLWGNRCDAVANRLLRQALYALRRLLGDGLESDVTAVQLRAGVVTLDVNELEADIRAGRAADAIARVDGEFLDGLEDAGDEPLRSWILAERSGLHALITHALDSLALAARQNGHWDVVQPLARRVADARPWDERSQARLIEVLSGAGRTHEAAGWHARAVERLRTELDEEPSPGFIALSRKL